jgi:hypothetical protein
MQLSEYSAGYLMGEDVEVNTYEGEEALMDIDLFESIARAMGEPVIGYTGGIHYDFKPSATVLGKRCAVPRRNHEAVQNSMTLLLAK